MSHQFQDASVSQAWVCHARQLLAASGKSEFKLMGLFLLASGTRCCNIDFPVFSPGRPPRSSDRGLAHSNCDQFQSAEMLTLITLQDLKKPLKVNFVGGGEHGVDLGGTGLACVRLFRAGHV